MARHGIHHRIDVSAFASHTFTVELTIEAPAATQRLALPVWIPGSYLVREFARHLSALAAAQGGRPVPVRQLDKASWQATCSGDAPLVVRFRVYAFDTSVRAAFLDADRGFFNGTSVCLRVEGRAAEPQSLAVVGLPDGWDVATALTPWPGGDAPPHTYAAADYDELVDHPVELGRHWRGGFSAGGVPHELVVAGALPDFDGARLLADTQTICEAEIRFWHGDGKPPFERYVFLLNALEDGRGGLEHRASTALVAPRRDLPAIGNAETSDGYVDVLGLVAHEYFHAWNVKRLTPRDFAPLDYGRENHTELLWFFEGFTSYYDDIVVMRAGLIDSSRYLKLIGKTMSAVQAMPGAALQSVAEASFDAWTKFYRPDENTPNATVNYYAKGSLVALAFDLTLRAEGRGTLDDVMRRLWQASGGGAIEEADIAAALEAIGGRSYAPELAAWVHGTGPLPLAELLQRFTVASERQPATLAQRLGVRVAESALTGVKVTHVLRGGAGERLGLSAGDEVLAVGGWRLRRLDDALRALGSGGIGGRGSSVGSVDSGSGGGSSSAVPCLVARDQRVVTLQLDPSTLAGAESGAVLLKATAEADAAARLRFEAWTRG